MGGHVRYIWSLIRDGDVAKAQRMIEVVQFKVQQGLITKIKEDDRVMLDDYNLIIKAVQTKDAMILSGCHTLNRNLITLISTYLQLTANP